MGNLHSFQALTAVWFLDAAMFRFHLYFAFQWVFAWLSMTATFFHRLKWYSILIQVNLFFIWVCHHFLLLFFFGKEKKMHLPYVLTDEVWHIRTKTPFLNTFNCSNHFKIKYKNMNLAIWLVSWMKSIWFYAQRISCKTYRSAVIFSSFLHISD